MRLMIFSFHVRCRCDVNETPAFCQIRSSDWSSLLPPPFAVFATRRGWLSSLSVVSAAAGFVTGVPAVALTIAPVRWTAALDGACGLPGVGPTDVRRIAECRGHPPRNRKPLLCFAAAGVGSKTNKPLLCQCTEGLS